MSENRTPQRTASSAFPALSGQGWGVVLSLASLLVLLVITGFRQGERLCRGVVVQIDHETGRDFLQDADILALLANDSASGVIGTPVRELNTRELESRVRKNPYVRRAVLSHDLAGYLHISIEQEEPIARLLRPGMRDAYVTAEGKMIPVSTHFTADVPLIWASSRSFSFARQEQDVYAASVLEVMRQIHQNELWRSMIAEVELQSDSSLQFRPQIGQQTIFFGRPEKIPAKFAKLEHFYRQIVAVKGWGRYQRVSVAFLNQISCE